MFKMVNFMCVFFVKTEMAILTPDSIDVRAKKIYERERDEHYVTIKKISPLRR